MLAGYYHSIGLYAFSPSESENEENEGESIASVTTVMYQPTHVLQMLMNLQHLPLM